MKSHLGSRSEAGHLGNALSKVPWLETPQGCRDLEVLASTLQTIPYTAERLGETVEYGAERIECAHEDPALA